jgi:hypothetical protein
LLCSWGAGASSVSAGSEIERRQSTQDPKSNSKSKAAGALASRLSTHVTAQDDTGELNVPWYTGTMKRDAEIVVERVQTGVRLEKRLLKVLKAFAEYHDLTLGDLLEGIVLHAFDGKIPFTRASLERIKDLKKFYGLELDSTASHRLKEDAKKLRPSR